jgi:hypothetical protein
MYALITLIWVILFYKERNYLTLGILYIVRGGEKRKTGE